MTVQWEPEVDARAKATPLTTENTAEWLAVAHVRGYLHLSTLCPVCKVERYWIDQTLSADERLAEAKRRHPSNQSHRVTEQP